MSEQGKPVERGIMETKKTETSRDIVLGPRDEGDYGKAKTSDS